MTIQIEPSKEHPIPYVVMDDETSSFSEELSVAANTQDLLDQLGAPPEISSEDAVKAASTISEAMKTLQLQSPASKPGTSVLGSTNGTRFSQALAGGRVGFGLGGALGQQAQRFFGRVGQRFFDVAQV